jgi:hypothetical protein
MWFPVALLSEYITWQEVDHDSFDVTFTDCGKSVTARFIIDELGRLVNFIAKRWYSENQGAYTLETWTTPMVEWGRLAGLNLPIRVQAMWKLPVGDFPYGDVRLTDVEYNGPIENI